MTEVPGPPATLIDLLTAADPAQAVVTFSDTRAGGGPDETVQAGGGAGETVRAGALLTEAERIARLLGSPTLGLHRGDPVITCVRPSPALLGVLAGVARAGLVEVPVATGTPPSAPSSGVAEASGNAVGARVAVVGTAVLAADPSLARLAPVVLTVDDGGGPGSLDDLRPGPLRRPPRPGDPALVLSTSGTTGRPKGVLLPHFAGVRHARRVTHSLRYGPDDVLYNAFPWHHVNIRHTGLFAALVSGARLLAVPRFSASTFWDLCRERNVTSFNFMGAVAAILLRSDTSPGDRAHRVTRAYGGPAPRWLTEQFHERFGVHLVEAYACTELGDVTSNSLGDSGPGTAGRPLPEYDLELRDDNNLPVPDGEVGRITVRPRHPHISTLGYLGHPGPPPEWISTGDLGRKDSAGRLTFCGRRSDVVRRRGENISAWEIESVVAALPGVREAAALGVPSEFTEEDLLLAVVPAEAGRTTEPALTAEAVHAWCRDRLPRHAWPRYVVLLDALPRNASSKVSKPALRDPAVLAVAADLEHLRRAAGKEQPCESWT